MSASTATRWCAGGALLIGLGWIGWVCGWLLLGSLGYISSFDIELTYSLGLIVVTVPIASVAAVVGWKLVRCGSPYRLSAPK
jgi:hypothetical protein